MKFERSYDGVVVGAGVAGLTAALRMAQSGMRVLVLERHYVAGGCASFYQHGGYRFDVGATLVAGFGPRGAHAQIFSELRVALDAVRVEPAMVVHVGKATVTRYGDARWQSERLRAFGANAEPFWRAQERVADLAWDFSSRMPALPVDVSGALAFARAFRPRQFALLPAMGKTLASLLPRDASATLRAFVDAQLLITAQCDASTADLIYGATALDLAREGTYHLAGGVSAIATALARGFRKLGGSIAYGAAATRVAVERGRVCAVEAGTERIETPRVVLALPVQNAAALCAELRRSFAPKIAALPQRWGAFMVYAGVPAGVVADDATLHHQIVVDPAHPLGEGNSVFASLSPPGEHLRARGGGRAITLSTHTDVARWERAARAEAVPALRTEYARRLLGALERALPGTTARIDVLDTATPHTFERFTGRSRGLVGGVPQTPATASIGAFSHRTPVRGVYLCGDTAFPGQSTVGATLSGNAAGVAAAS